MIFMDILFYLEEQGWPVVKFCEAQFRTSQGKHLVSQGFELANKSGACL